MISLSVDPVSGALLAVLIAYTFRTAARVRRIEDFLIHNFKSFYRGY